MAVKRGCGTRIQGACYLETPLGPHGKPIEHFLVDPPVPIDARANGVSPVGVSLFPDSKGTEGTPGKVLHHVFDWVGAESYPNVADFVEEVRRFGLSRRIARTVDFSLLGPGSKIFLLHANAVIENWAEHYLAISRAIDCPKQKPEHYVPNEMCAGLWWHDLEGTEDGPGDFKQRRVGDTLYYGLPPAVKSSHELGLFAIFPLAQVAVIRARDGGHELTEHAAGRGGLPVSLEDE